MEEMEDMELCGTITVAPMDAAAVPKAEAATAKPCVIRPISEVISSCRKRKLDQLTLDELDENTAVNKEKKHKKKSKKVKKERIDDD